MDISIGKSSIPTVIEDIEIDKLNYYRDNPRVYSVIRDVGRKLPSNELQEVIHKKMTEVDNVIDLMNRIYNHGGLIEPILVRKDTMEVIEGNSRLAAYRLLNDQESHKWNKIRCMVVQKLSDFQQDAYLSELHLKGKKDWERYEQANFFYRRIVEDHKSYSEMRSRTGFKEGEMKHLVETIQMMKENNDGDRSHFSHYYEGVIKQLKVRGVVRDNFEVKEWVFKKIKNNEITALDLRNKFKEVVANPKILEKLIKGQITLAQAYEDVKTSSILKRLKRVTSILEDIYALPKSEQKVFIERELAHCQNESAKIKSLLTRLDKFLAKCEQIKNKG